MDITAKKQLPIHSGLAIWGKKWTENLVLVWCDNLYIAQDVMHLMQSLFFITTSFSLSITPQHLSGYHNNLRLVNFVRKTILLWVTGESLCPVAAVLHYIRIRGIETGPLFCFSDRRTFAQQRFVSSISQSLSCNSLDSSLYSSYSFRTGTTTTIAAQGVSDALFKTMCKWESIGYPTYIQNSPLTVLMCTDVCMHACVHICFYTFTHLYIFVMYSLIDMYGC